MSNPRRRRASRNRRRTSANTSPRRRYRRSNPGPKLRRYTRRHHARRSNRRRSNPGMGGNIIDMLKPVIAGAISSVVTPTITDGLLSFSPGMNTGITGYGASIAVALGLAWLTKKMTKSQSLAIGVAVGGAASVVVRAYQENVGNLHTGMSAYETTPFYLPSVSVPDPSGSGMVAVQPAFTAPQIPTVTAAQASSVGTPGGGQAGRLAAFSRYH